MSTPRLRHRPQVEDEDAAALKLGSGEPVKYLRMLPGTHPKDGRVQQRRLSAHFGGEVLAREQGEGATRHCVRYDLSAQCTDFSCHAVCTTKLWST